MPPAPPAVDTVYRPLREYIFDNPAKVAVDKVNAAMRKGKDTQTRSTEVDMHDGLESPNYALIDDATNAMYRILSKHEKDGLVVHKNSKPKMMACIRNRLMKYRAAISGGVG